MAMLLVLLPSDAEASLRPETVGTLMRLGITRLALVRDGRSLGVLVEGWQFDPVGSSASVIGAVAGGAAGARVLHPIAEMDLAPGQ